jgi:hypothetical protein
LKFSWSERLPDTGGAGENIAIEKYHTGDAEEAAGYLRTVHSKALDMIAAFLFYTGIAWAVPMPCRNASHHKRIRRRSHVDASRKQQNRAAFAARIIVSQQQHLPMQF